MWRRRWLRKVIYGRNLGRGELNMYFLRLNIVTSFLSINYVILNTRNPLYLTWMQFLIYYRMSVYNKFKMFTSLHNTNIFFKRLVLKGIVTIIPTTWTLGSLLLIGFVGTFYRVPYNYDLQSNCNTSGVTWVYGCRWSFTVRWPECSFALSLSKKMEWHISR